MTSAMDSTTRNLSDIATKINATHHHICYYFFNMLFNDYRDFIAPDDRMSDD
jgi:hypothetical protein